MKTHLTTLIFSICLYFSSHAQTKDNRVTAKEQGYQNSCKQITGAILNERAKAIWRKKDTLATYTFCIIIRVKHDERKKSKVESITIEPDEGILRDGFFSKNLTTLRKLDYLPLMNGKNQVTFVIPFSEFPTKFDRIIGYDFMTEQIKRLFYKPRKSTENVVYLEPISTHPYSYLGYD